MTIQDLATEAEVKEAEAIGKFSAPNHDPSCKHEHTVLRYAFRQSGFGVMKDIHYWHVISEGRSHHSTLSMDGLRDWGLI